VHRHSEHEENRQGEHRAKNRINVKTLKQFQGEVRAQHQEPGVGQVHNFHDAVNHGHPDRHRRIHAGQKQRFQQQVEILDSIHG